MLSVYSVNVKLDNTWVYEGRGTSPHILKQWLNLCKSQFQLYFSDSVSPLSSSEIRCEFEAGLDAEKGLSLGPSALKPKL